MVSSTNWAARHNDVETNGLARHLLSRVVVKQEDGHRSAARAGYEPFHGAYGAEYMTMILTALGEETGLFVLRDILTSTPQKVRAKVPLPLQFEALVHSAGDYSVAGFAQKLTLVSPTVLVAWAGSYVVACALIKAIKDAARPDVALDLATIVSTAGPSEAEIERVSLIVHQVLGDHIQIHCLNAEHGRIDGVDAAWSGSGSFDFLHDTIIERGGADSSFAEILRGLLLRAATTLAGEAISGSNYDYLYGGWFELVISRTLGLQKIPYAIKFWGRRGNEFGFDAPLFFSWYKGSSLFVCSLDQHSDTSDVRVIEVPSLLSGKPWRRVQVRPRFEPEFTFHVVLDDDEPQTEIHVSDRHSMGHMDVEVTKRGGYVMKVDEAFISQIMGRKTKPAFSVTKASYITE